jgi:hypothetical protein
VDEQDEDGDTLEVSPDLRDIPVLQQDANLSPFVDTEDLQEIPAIRDALIAAIEALRRKIREHPVDARAAIRPAIESEAGGPDHVTLPVE